jgi:RNA polymerase sigma factor (sigma-70 family)
MEAYSMKDECYKKHRRKGTIRIGDVMFIVTGDEYAQYYAELERKKYVRRQEGGKRISYEEALEDGTPIDLLSANPQISVEEEAEKNVLIELMLNAIEQLDAADKQLIRLLFFYEFSCREISRQLGVDEGTIRYRKNKILQKLRKALGLKAFF